MTISQRLTISAVALCNGILMALTAKTHVPPKLLHVGSTLVSMSNAHMAPFHQIV